MSFKEKFKVLIEEKNFPTVGIIASIVLFLAMFVPQIGYKGRSSESYSMLNHMVSELGEIGVSYLWWIFSLCLIVGGLLFIPFMIGLGCLFEHKIAKLATIMGVISSIACALVGVFPMNFLFPHYISAMLFFYGAMVTIALFTISIVLEKNPKLPKWFVILGVIVALIFVLMLTSINLSSLTVNMDSTGAIINRPNVWLMSILEWAAVLSIMAYLFIVSLYLRLKTTK